MKKKWLSPVAALLCAVFAFINCSVHFSKPRQVKSQVEKSFATCVDWYGEDGSILRLLSDGSGTLNGRALVWKERGGRINCSLFPESSIGRSFELTEVFDKVFPLLECGDTHYSIARKAAEAEEAESAEEKHEPTREELIAQEGLEAANLCFGFIGWNYKYGGKTPETGFDCSGLAYYVFEQLGYRLERVANAQKNQGISIAKEDVQPGDLLCFGAPDYCHHVGIYVGQGYYIHAMGSAYGVVASALDDPELKRPKYEVRRIAGCDWLKIENIEAALAAGLPTPTPPVGQ